MISDGSEKKKQKKNNCSQLKKRTYLTIQSDKPSTKCKTVQKKKKHTPIVRHILLKKTQSQVEQTTVGKRVLSLQLQTALETQ